MSTHGDPRNRLSRILSRILRHQALAMGLTMTADGFVLVDDLLSLKECRSYTLADIRFVVENNDKQRFEFDDRVSPPRIRAVQGHSIDLIDEDLLLEEVSDPSLIPICIHGTYDRFMEAIMRDGLKRMGRTHIHMAAGLPHEVHSGARKNVEVLIYVDVALAMADGIKFFRSRNGVILTAGLAECEGVLPSKYFEKVIPYKRPPSNNSSSSTGKPSPADEMAS
jgi:2'-phosphotransferase